MTVLGLDPGLTTTGYGVVTREAGRMRAVAYGAIRTPTTEEAPARLVRLRAEVLELLREHEPDAVALERLLFSTNRKTVMDVARASGVILLAIGEAGLRCAEYSPPEVKLAVTGVGQAEKRQVRYMVTQILGLQSPPSPLDAADALALAVCHHHSVAARRLRSDI